MSLDFKDKEKQQDTNDRGGRGVEAPSERRPSAKIMRFEVFKGRKEATGAGET